MKDLRIGYMIITALIFTPGNIKAQDGFTLKQDSLQSVILKQNRKIAIYLPEGYDTAVTKFPVIYVLDAEWRDQHIVPTARFLFLSTKMPKAIIVGVNNIDRNHDFLSDSTASAPSGGGADNFIRFFKDELIPYIDKNFRTESYKVLVGHSYGGLYAMYSLLMEPDLFDSYIAIDPSIWYNNLAFLKSAQVEFPSAKNWNRSLFIAGREGEGMNEMGITRLDSVMKASAPKGLNWKISAYADEDHGSVPFKSVYDGFRFLFDAGGTLRVFPDAGVVPEGRSFDIYLWNINPDMRYTTDGSEPTADSPKCETKMRLTGGCTLKIKSITRKYKIYPTYTFIFRQDKFFQGLKSVKNLKPGLKYQYFEGAWDSIPDFSILKPVEKGVTENIDLNMTSRKDSFALHFEGYLHITEENMYNFWIMSDEGSELYLNNQLILSNDGPHDAELPRVTVIPLSPGYYPVTLNYFEKAGNESISAGMIKDMENPAPKPFPLTAKAASRYIWLTQMAHKHFCLSSILCVLCVGLTFAYFAVKKDLFSR
jgi:predicted alpha/beta superfamily hydrolase